MGKRTELALLAVLVLIAAAFIISFVLGLMPGKQPLEPRPFRSLAGSAIPLDSIQVEVLNASGREGLARGATERLRAVGIDVVYFGNASATRDSAVVIDRVGRPTFARAVAIAMGITNVRTELDSTRVVDVSVILGRNWGAGGN